MNGCSGSIPLFQTSSGVEPPRGRCFSVPNIFSTASSTFGRAGTLATRGRVCEPRTWELISGLSFQLFFGVTTSPAFARSSERSSEFLLGDRSIRGFRSGSSFQDIRLFRRFLGADSLFGASWPSARLFAKLFSELLVGDLDVVDPARLSGTVAGARRGEDRFAVWRYGFGGNGSSKSNALLWRAL